jgi:hydroxymethylbilane synthase
VSSAAQLRIATRKSKLALWQAEHVAMLLRAAHPDLEVELVPMSTQGDRILDRSLASIGGKGLFIKELEVALHERRADIAVHSMKDVPTDVPAGFAIGAVLERADPRDAFVCVGPATRIEDLPQGARIGTSSLRRQAQLYAARRDLRVEALRGNVDTRLRRLDAGEMDAILLACAGLDRLGLQGRITTRLDAAAFMPAVTQGVIGIECRSNDAATRALLAPLENAPTRTVMDAERAFAAALGGSCTSPVACHASLSGESMTVSGLVAEPDGSKLLRDTLRGRAADAMMLGRALAERMHAAGAGALLERLRTA